MTDVFISYSRKDKVFVRKVFDALESTGKDAWVDWENIPLTADWLEEIKDGIEAADSFIYVISPDSVHSDVCAIELGHALENKKRLIPVMHRELIEAHDQAALHPMISSHNWLFFREDDDFDAAFKLLHDALDADLDHMRTHTRLLVRAKEWTDRNRDTSLLLHGNDLQEAEAWLTVAMSKQPEPTELHTDYIMTSHNTSNTRQRRLMTQILFALVIAVALALIAGFQWQRAQSLQIQAEAARDDAEREAEISGSLAVASIAQQTNDRILAISLALAASAIDEPPGLVERALADVVYAPGVRDVYDSPDSDSALSTVAYSSDNTKFAVGTTDGEIIIWDIPTHEILHTLSAVENGNVTSLDFSSNDDLLSAGSDGRVLLWDSESGEIIQEFAHDVSVTVAIFSPDESLITVGLASGQISVWNSSSGEIQDSLIVPTEAENIDPITSLAYSPDMTLLAVGFDSGRIGIWDSFELPDPKLSRVIHSDTVTGIVFSPDGDAIYSASSDETAYKLSAANLRIEREFAGHTNQVMDIDVASDGLHIVTTSMDRTLIYWDAETGNELERLWAHGNWVNGVQFSNNSRRAITASQDGTAIEWDLRPGNILHVYRGHNDWIRTADLSNDNSMAVSGSDDGEIIVWNVEDETIITKLLGHSGDVRGVRFTPDDTRVVSASLDGTVRVWTIADGSYVEYDLHNGEGVHSVYIAQDGERVITGAADGSIRLWNIDTGEIIHELNEHSDIILDIRISPDGKFALSASEDGLAKYWDLETGTKVLDLVGHGREALSIAFSPDGTKAVSGSRDSEFFYWDLETGQPIRPPAIVHGSSVRGIDYSPVDNNTAISASADLLMFQWDLASGEVIREFSAHERVVYSVDFSSDGTQVLSSSRDKTLILWRVDDLESLLEWMRENRYLRNLSEDECKVYRISTCPSAE